MLADSPADEQTAIWRGIPVNWGAGTDSDCWWAHLPGVPNLEQFVQHSSHISMCRLAQSKDNIHRLYTPLPPQYTSVSFVEKPRPLQRQLPSWQQQTGVVPARFPGSPGNTTTGLPGQARWRSLYLIVLDRIDCTDRRRGSTTSDPWFHAHVHVRVCVRTAAAYRCGRKQTAVTVMIWLHDARAIASVLFTLCWPQTRKVTSTSRFQLRMPCTYASEVKCKCTQLSQVQSTCSMKSGTGPSFNQKKNWVWD